MEAYMINIVTNQNFLSDTSDGIVIPVNTVGVPGAGLALSWAKQYPMQQGSIKPRAEIIALGLAIFSS